MLPQSCNDQLLDPFGATFVWNGGSEIKSYLTTKAHDQGQLVLARGWSAGTWPWSSSLHWFFILWLADYSPPFSHRILYIVFLCTEKKMLWIDAGWIIAMMAHLQFFWKASDENEIRNAVSAGMRTLTFYVKIAVVVCFTASPIPTTGLWIFNIITKQFLPSFGFI